MDATTYGLIGAGAGFGIIVVTVVVLAIVLYIRRRRQEKIQQYIADLPPEPKKPPDPEYPPGYLFSGQPHPGEELILVPPVVAPLPPVDYGVDAPDDGRPLPPPQGYVVPIEPDKRPRAAEKMKPPKPPKQPKQKDKPMKKKKKKRHHSSSSSSSSSSCDCHKDSCSECCCYSRPQVMPVMLVPTPTPPQVTSYTAAMRPAGAMEEQTRQAIIGNIMTPCTSPACF